jgi:hypothetical protein
MDAAVATSIACCMLQPASTGIGGYVARPWCSTESPTGWSLMPIRSRRRREDSV